MTIRHIEIDCRAARNEVVTTIHHDPETTRLDDRDSESTNVTIASRTFPAYAACPISTARKLAADTRAMMPGVLVSLYNA